MPADNFHTARAKSLLAHYLKFGLEAAGYRWDGDNQSEVADIVDSIIDASTAGSPSPSSATPSISSTPSTAPQSDWIELTDGGWVRASEIYRIDIAISGALLCFFRCQDDAITIDADDPNLGAVLTAVGIYTDR